MTLRFSSRLLAALWLAVALLGTAGPLHAEALTPDQETAVQKLIHDYLLEHPAVIIQALKDAQAKTEADAVETARKTVAAKRSQIFSDPDSPVGGNPQGDVTLVEFFDYRCPYCKEVEPSIEALVKQDGKLRIVYKEYPILGPDSVYASRVALAAKRQGKYAEFHRIMMAQKGKIDEAVILKAAATAGLNADRLKSDLAAPEIDRVLQNDFDLADALDIQGTPAFIVGDQLVPGAADLDSLRRLIAAARKGS